MIERSPERLNDKDFRQRWISEAAYFRAEQRGFAYGMALNDWLVAEYEYKKMQILRYLAIVEEDGCMSIKGLQRLAGFVGVSNAAEMHEKTGLIHAIQQACGTEDCFTFGHHHFCDHKENCLWRGECKTMIAKWRV